MHIVDSNLPPNAVSDAAENVLQHLKNMFCHLQHSEKQYYDPSETFCKAFKDRSGNPIDLHMQQDAEEFLRLLCERLEELLKGTEYVRTASCDVTTTVDTDALNRK